MVWIVIYENAEGRLLEADMRSESLFTTLEYLKRYKGMGLKLHGLYQRREHV